MHYPLDDPSLTAQQARSEVLDFGPSDLNFPLDEIKTLFGNLLGKLLSEAEAPLLAKKNRGLSHCNANDRPSRIVEHCNPDRAVSYEIPA
ncbi:MAG: hypothetical protein KGS46_17140 [Chloroflexi bacterium]|nr:hypothetical protein [Chloroflexota bacterium]